MLCFINIWPLPLAKNNLERRQKKLVGNISACSSNNMGESQSQPLRPFGPAEKNNLQIFPTSVGQERLGFTWA